MQTLMQFVYGPRQQKVKFNLPQPAREILRSDDADLIYYQVLGLRGEFISGERDFPAPPDDQTALPGAVYLRDDIIPRPERACETWLGDPRPCWGQTRAGASG